MEQTENLNPIQINGNFTSAEFRYIIERSGVKLTEFALWCNKSKVLPHSYDWFHRRFSPFCRQNRGEAILIRQVAGLSETSGGFRE